jgi:adenylate cyclase
LAKDKHPLSCFDSYDHASRAHTSGIELHRREMPAFFDLLESGEEMSIVNAAVDRRCAQVHASIMQSLGSSALTLVPLRRSKQIAGAICLEDAGPIDGGRDFMQTSAALVYSALSATEIKSQDPGATRVRAPRDHPPRELPVQPIPSTDLAPTPAERASLRSEYFPEVAVMALHLSGALGLAKKCGAAEPSMAVQISECLQEMAAEHGVTYLKFVGQNVTAAVGFDRPDAEAMAAVAELAIAVQERLSSLVESSGHAAEFRIGLAFGGCYGCLLGRERHQFNLWGDAFETAELMAHSASSGSIQASDGAYARLREDFLFRPRGNFYQPGVGQLRSFILAGLI